MLTWPDQLHIAPVAPVRGKQMLEWQSWIGVNVQIYFLLNLWKKKKKKKPGTWPLPALENGLGLCPPSLLSSGKELQLACSASMDGSDKRCCSCWNLEQWLIRSQIREKGQHSSWAITMPPSDAEGHYLGLMAPKH